MHNATINSFKALPLKVRKSITHDNGLENALHEHTNKVLGIKSYFCNPYHSWEK